jgi:hypothetical protein
MATWIKGTDCACPECGATPCAPGCDCTFSASENDGFEDGPALFEKDYDVTGQFLVEKSVAIAFAVVFPSPPMYAQMYLLANGVEIYTSGCISTSVSTSVAVPAGTTTLKVYVFTECTGTWVENEWTLTLECEDAP